MNRLWFVALGMVVAGGVAGCTSLARPNWAHPGPADYQQSRAQLFDPYPENEPGPRIVGARPLEFDRPPAEVLRVQPPLDPLRARWRPQPWMMWP